jgi:hypothetical protein
MFPVLVDIGLVACRIWMTDNKQITKKVRIGIATSISQSCAARAIIIPYDKGYLLVCAQKLSDVLKNNAKLGQLPI